MKKLILLASLVFTINAFAQKNSSNLNNAVQFPLINPKNSKDIEALDFTAKNYENSKNSFLGINPDYFQTGKYFYSNGDYSFNYTDYPSIQENSQNLLDSYNSVQVHFPVFSYYGWYTSNFEITPGGTKYNTKLYNIINSYFKSEISVVLKNKNAKNIFIADMLNDKLSFCDSLSNSLILQFNNEDIAIWLDKGSRKRFPDFARYSLSVINVKGEIVKKYRQVVFLKNTGSYPGFINATIAQAFNCLLNQFLNDTQTALELKTSGTKQLNVTGQSYLSINKIQFDLLNIMFEKNKIISQLGYLGQKLDGISSDTYLNPNSLYNYNPSYSAQANQTAADAGQLAGSVVNLLEAIGDRKEKNKENLIANQLKIKFQRLDIDEKNLSQSISPEILNSQSVLFLPNNSELNKSMKIATQNLAQKSELANSNISNQYSKITNDLNAHNSQIESQQNSQLSAESSASTNGGNFNKNAGAAKKCADDTQSQWKGTTEYNNYIKNPSCNKMAYISNKKLAEMLLQSCRQYLPQAEIEGFDKTISSLQATINGMEDCKTYNFGK